MQFEDRLVLNQWMLSLFDRGSFDELVKPLKSLDAEGLDENNVHRFLHAIRLLWEFPDLPADDLLRYDGNIVRHTLRLSERRREPLRWKYFQWLSLLFAEIYLDRFFRDPGKLLAELNDFVAKFNLGKSSADQIPAYEPDDLTKIAFWSATGSGKTLLMHVNILQYRHYLEAYGRERELNRVILLTPNEGLSRQHLFEFRASGLSAAIFSKDAAGLFAGHDIEIIDIHKLREESKEKTVAVESFEGNNLVLVDEGHRGASSSEVGHWMTMRNRLCEHGFSFEYSATFGQAMKGKGELENQYAKCILFDYSYKYFYKDGFGKDYRILNLADDSEEDKRRLYLTACLLMFYQQQRLYLDREQTFRPFLLESPLWVFVGGTVNAVRSENKKKVSDVVDILLFLAEFVKDKGRSIELLTRLLSGKPGLLDQRGNEIFATAYSFLAKLGKSPEQTYDDILAILFNSPVPGALHIENLKGPEGEIALRLGENEPFGLINVGDASKLCDMCEEQGDIFVVAEKEFSHSLFDRLDDDDSKINILIGSKKFTEGWNSWRVSTMGLMNVGRSEGSEIIQLFGRGVRLKGLGMSLKRSSALMTPHRPEHIGLLETLNVFGIRSQYMQQFKEYLEAEGMPANEDRIEFILPVVKNLDGRKLTTIRLREGIDFKRQGPKPVLGEVPGSLIGRPIEVNWYPKVQAQQSKGAARTADAAVLEEGRLEEQHLAFLDPDAIWFELERFKNERAWFNLTLPREAPLRLLQSPNWYRLFIPKSELECTRFDRVRRWQEIAVALLKKYIDRYYLYQKTHWEKDFLEYHELREDDPNFLEEYRLLIEKSQDAIVENLAKLRELLERRAFAKDWEFGNLKALWFGQHLYQPLLHCKSELVEVSPVSLNEGERDFVLDLRTFYEQTPDFFREREMYLLRNMSRGRGIGFFEAGNFHPDFILWLLSGGKQYVTFIDPKGIRNLDGPGDPKIHFHKTVKLIEARLADPLVVLNSFIISVTPFREIAWWREELSKDKLTQSHVLFQPDDRETYVSSLLKMILANQERADTV